MSCMSKLVEPFLPSNKFQHHFHVLRQSWSSNFVVVSFGEGALTLHCHFDLAEKLLAETVFVEPALFGFPRFFDSLCQKT